MEDNKVGILLISVFTLSSLFSYGGILSDKGKGGILKKESNKNFLFIKIMMVF